MEFAQILSLIAGVPGFRRLEFAQIRYRVIRMIIRSKAPLRVSFCGGGSDVPPYPGLRGGVVLSTTICKYAYATLTPRIDDRISINSLDYGISDTYDAGTDLDYNGKLDLIKAVIRRMNNGNGLNIVLHSDVAPGSGLGSSSAVAVALVALLNHWLCLSLNKYEIAQLAFSIERQDLGIKGGLQDQYASAFGGFNFMEFLASSVVVNPLRIAPDILNELHYCLLLCYTGKTRLSSNIISDQIHSYIRRDADVIDAIEEMKKITVEMKNALLKGHLNEFGRLLDQAWQWKKRVSQKISDSDINCLYKKARQMGALGGKLLGAGGGGYLLLYCNPDRKYVISEELEKLGGEIMPFTFDRDGVQTWRIEKRTCLGKDALSSDTTAVRSLAMQHLSYETGR